MITKQDAMTCQMFYHVTLRNSDGSALRARRNGKTKIWKRSPERFQVPVKYGLRECFYITEDSAYEWLTYDRVQRALERKDNCCRVGLPDDVPDGVLRDAMLDAGLIKE